MLNCHPDAIIVRVVLVPAIENVTIFPDAAKRVMSEAWSHYHVFIHALKLFYEEFLHPSCSVYLGMDLQHLWVGLMIVYSTVRPFWAEPYVDLDVVLLGSTFMTCWRRSSHYVGVKLNCPYIKLRWFVKRDIPGVRGVQRWQMIPAIFIHHAPNVSAFWDCNQDDRLGTSDAHTWKYK